MGVYNPNMKMPENCYLCGYSVCGCVTSNMILHCGVAEPMDFMEAQEHRHKDCPLVEVKAPHGRLIDADALIESNKYLRYNPAEHKEDSYDAGWAVGFNAGASHATEHAVYAPTIIEAEGKDNG